MAGNGDLQSHERTYSGMIGWLKWGAIITFVITFIVIWLIA